MSTETTAPARRRQVPKFMNKVMTLLLRSPLHRMMSQHIMLITFRGRKSGKLFTIPVGYVRQGDSVICFTERKWWRNLVKQPEVTLRIQGKRYQGTAEIIHDDNETIARELLAYCEHIPMAARAFNIRLDATGKPSLETTREAAQRLILVRVRIK
jgi:deazaflavin-dependent oxidoreductase (nitroreductase family)